MNNTISIILLLKLRQFLWDTFAFHYIEIIKNRAYNQETNSQKQNGLLQYTIHFLLERMLLLFYPIISSNISYTCRLSIKIDEFPKAKTGKSIYH